MRAKDLQCTKGLFRNNQVAISGYEVGSWPCNRWKPWAVCGVGLAISSNIPSKPLQSHPGSRSYQCGQDDSWSHANCAQGLLLSSGCLTPSQTSWVPLTVSSLSSETAQQSQQCLYVTLQLPLWTEKPGLDWVSSHAGTELSRAACFKWLVLAFLGPLYTFVVEKENSHMSLIILKKQGQWSPLGKLDGHIFYINVIIRS